MKLEKLLIIHIVIFCPGISIFMLLEVLVIAQPYLPQNNGKIWEDDISFLEKNCLNK